jgi:hypothetical protein
MPIHTMRLKDGVFFARQVGYVDNVDVRMWGSALEKYAAASPLPIMAVIDLGEADRVCPTVIREISSVLAVSHLMGVAIAAGDNMASRNAQVLSTLGALRGVRVFATLQEAREYADNRLNAVSGGFVTCNSVSFSPVGSF